jgi:hypothetical protein
MKQHLGMLLVIVIGLAGFSAYCYACLDWIQDYTGGVYARDQWEGCYETAALVVYTLAALRFMVQRVSR